MEHRVEALTGLIPICLEPLKQQVLDEALNAARRLPSGQSRSTALLTLIDHAPQALQTQLLKEALAVAREIGDQDGLASTLVEVVPSLPGALKAEGFESTLALARQVSSLEERAGLLAALETHLPGLFKEAFEAARAIQSPEGGRQALVRLVPRAPVALLKDFLQAVPELFAKDQVELLQTLAPSLSADLLQEAVATVSHIPAPSERLKALQVLAPYFSGELSQRALEIARQLEDPMQSAGALIALSRSVGAGLRGLVFKECLGSFCQP